MGEVYLAEDLNLGRFARRPAVDCRSGEANNEKRLTVIFESVPRVITKRAFHRLGRFVPIRNENATINTAVTQGIFTNLSLLLAVGTGHYGDRLNPRKID